MTNSSSKQPREWTIKDLYNRAEHIRAVPILVLEKWEREQGVQDSVILTTGEIHDELLRRGLLKKSQLKQAQGSLIGGFRQKQKRLNLRPLFVEQIAVGEWRFSASYYERILREFREQYPILGESTQMPSSFSLRDEVLEAVQGYEKAWKQILRDAENRAEALEQENRELRERLRNSRSSLGEISDEVLRRRIEPLLGSPLDTVIREASVVLEDRLRSQGEVGGELEGTGTKLVDRLFNPGTGRLVFSSNPGEQDGVRMLYRGAMQFIRNPPMHKLIEYPDDTARLFIRLIDSLLLLLSEARSQEVEESYTA